jgi:transcriptional regulator with XRE-family HTH domain
VAYNPNILHQALQARHLTATQLSQRLGIDVNELSRELRREPEPKSDLLKSVARELLLPQFAFYMRELPALQESIPDFRNPNPAPSAKAWETLESIQFAEGIQKTLVDLDTARTTNLPGFTVVTNEEIAEDLDSGFSLGAYDNHVELFCASIALNKGYTVLTTTDTLGAYVGMGCNVQDLDTCVGN